ncbi:MAG TPA: hypothetical protein VF548_09545 [Allosphingosinicella sp.]|jgi:hypothetical protein
MPDGRPWDRRRRLETAFAAVVAAATIWAAWGLWHDYRLPGRLMQIQLGTDRKHVEAVLGTPDWQGPCLGYLTYLPRADCTIELGYSSAFAPLRPVHWVVQLDRSGKVIETQPVRSR